MLYFSFGIGMLLGVFLGILVVGLCRISSERNSSPFDDPYFTAGFGPQGNRTETNMDEVLQ